MQNVVEELMQYDEFFQRCSEREGSCMALFYTCVAANIPFVISDLPEGDYKPEESWALYIDRLIAAGDDKKGARDAEWLDGITDIRFAFGRELDQTDFSKAIAVEKQKLGRLPGTKQQRVRWGTRGGGDIFGAEDYERMDNLFDAYASDYKATGLSQRREQALIRYVKEIYLADKANEEGDYKSSQAHLRNADTILAGEAMRAKDEKPMEGFRFDACIDALEKAGFMEDGHFKSFEDTQRAIWEFIHGGDKPRYGYSLDVADQILLNWENNNRKNSGQAEVYELPAEMRLVDEHGEFEPEETDEEKALKAQMDLMPVHFQKEKADA